MIPRLSPYDALHCRPRNAERSSERVERHAIASQLTNVNNENIRQLRASVQSASAQGCAIAAPGLSVCDVLPLCAEPQMVRVHARWNIARVKNRQPSGDRTVRQHPCESVGADQDTTCTGMSVPITVQGLRPQPTLVLRAAVNVGPKSLTDGIGDPDGARGFHLMTRLRVPPRTSAPHAYVLYQRPTAAKIAATLAPHIADVVDMRAKEQMPRVAALRHVAVVTHIHASGNLAKRHDPCNAMRLLGGVEQSKRAVA